MAFDYDWSSYEVSDWWCDRESAKSRRQRNTKIGAPAGARIRDFEPAPCDGCPLWQRCKDRRLACQAFARFVDGLRWQSARREPDAATFDELFSDGD